MIHFALSLSATDATDECVFSLMNDICGDNKPHLKSGTVKQMLRTEGNLNTNRIL